MTIGELFGTLQQSVVTTWRKHLKTSKYSNHIALDEFYKEMPEKVDKLIEDWQGHFEQKVEDYKNVIEPGDDPIEYLKQLHDYVKDGYSLMDDESELESDLDDITSFIDSILYKLRELRESRVSLKDYLIECMENEEE